MSEPASPPPPPQPPAAPPAAGKSENRGLMIALSYLWLLCLVPLLVEKDDKEVQWHAKHGLVLLIAEVILFVLLSILMNIPVIGCGIFFLYWLLLLGIIVVHILCIVKGINGERFTVPYVSQYAEKF